MNISDVIIILKWWVVLFLIGISFFPFTYKIFNNFIDKGYIFSKILGLLFISYSIFVLSNFKLLTFSTINLIIIWITLFAVQLLILRKQKYELRKHLKIFIFEEFLFLIALIAWSYVRSFSPSIHGLEKFMDFGFINSILKTQYLPPRDMWLTPFSINYYYFGHLFTAVLTKLSQIPSFITFNLMIASLFAFTFTMSFSIGITLVKSIKDFSIKKSFAFGLFFAFFLSLAGNLQTVYTFFKSYAGSETAPPFWDLIFLPQNFPNSYWYPSATRFIYNTIHEFPSYSFVVADLHGHVLNIPVVLTIIALLFSIFISKKISALTITLVGFLLSVSYMTNAWDGLIYFGLSVFIIFFFNILISKSPLKKKVTRSVFITFKYMMFLLFLFFNFTFVFNRNFAPFASEIGINCSPDFLVKVEKLGPFVFEKGQCQITPIWQIFILYGFFFFLIFSFLIFTRKRKLIFSDYFVMIISFFSLILIMVPEFIYLKDIYSGHFRANTMFKLSYQAFIMFSFSSIYILIRILSAFKKSAKNRMQILGILGFLSGFLFLLFFVAVYPFFAIPSGYGGLNKYQGLDGLKYLNDTKSSDYRAINYINKYIKGQPVILEAQGDSYTDFARISANTGLPTVLGWTVHEWLWRGTYDIPSARFDDIKNLYETQNLKTAGNIIKKYDISLIYIGDMERDKYNVSENKFTSLGDLIYSNSESRIYKIRQGI